MSGPGPLRAAGVEGVSVLGRPGLVRDLLTLVLHDAPGTGSEHETSVAVLVDPTVADWDRARACGARVVLISHTPLEGCSLTDAVMAGADAVLHTDAGTDEIRRAVAVVAAGGTLLDHHQARALAETARALAADPNAATRLTPREADILHCVESGLSVKQTALRLGIALKTVENLQSRLFRKLGARNRAQAVMLARSRGLLAPTAPAHPELASSG